MWILPMEARPSAFHHFLRAQLRADEPLWHAAYGMRVATISRAKAWGAVKALGREVKKIGVGTTIAGVALGVVAIAALPSSFADLEWPENGREGWSPVALEGIMVGLAPERLILLATGETKSPDLTRRAYGPLWVASLGPSDLATAKLRIREKNILGHNHVVLSLGEREEEETFYLDESFQRGNLAQARAIAARLSR